MIEQDGNQILIQHQDGTWAAEHVPHGVVGPERICWRGQEIVSGTSFYVDDVAGDAAVVGKSRAYRKSGVAIVSTSGKFPFGRPIEFKQTCRYAGNLVRVTFDIQWPRDTVVRRHLGIGGIVLPGEWKRFFCIPPAAHFGEGTAAHWETVPPAPGTGEIMLGHWHRPPLALVFERADGTSVEVGTGSDLWRWEHGFGAGTEAGSYKVMLTCAGIRLIREPLMCCSPYTPGARPYRFSWYMAWHGPTGGRASSVMPKGERKLLTLTANGELVSGTGEVPDCLGATGRECVVLDVGGGVWPQEWCRAASVPDFIRGRYSTAPCWHAGGVQKAARRAIRCLRAGSAEGELLLHGLNPGVCWGPQHLGRASENGLVHWDINAQIEFIVWARQHLGDGWRVWCEPSQWRELPSVDGGEQTNGFNR